MTDMMKKSDTLGALPVTVLGSTGIWCAWPIGWTIAAIVSIVFYKQSLSDNRAEKCETVF